jgi:aryl carrier-like protein
VIETWADHVNLINMYGPAECTIYCIGKAEIKSNDQCSTIGKGVGALVWITDPEDSNCLTPIGGLGELLIEGPNVARGYLDEVQTKSAFIEDPTWAKPTGLASPRRFYKTGDLAYYNTDGSIGFVGRNDGQTKLRGQRLEVGEVEYQLRECFSSSGPVEVAVSVVIPSTGDKILAAFVVVQDTPEESKDAIISHSPLALARFQSLMVGVESKLHSILPSYMVPSVYVPIYKLPLSASGKVDRKRLQSLASELSFNQLSSFRETEIARSTPPSTRMEKTLHSYWKALLNTDQIGVEDNFFRMGGDSMTAMRLVSLARKEGIAITVDEVFKNPILSDMALKAREEYPDEVTELGPFALVQDLDIEHLKREAVSQCRIRQDQIEDICYASLMQARWITGNDDKVPGDLIEHQGQIIFSLPKSLDLKRFRAAWRLVIRSTPILRTRFIQTSAGIFQVLINEPGKLRKAKSLDHYLQKDRANCIGFGDKLNNLCIVEVSADERYFVWSGQHATYDGWVLGQLFKQLEFTYLHGYSNWHPVRPTPFIKYIRECDIVGASNFWTSHLTGAVTKPMWVVPDNYGVFDITEKEKTFQLPKFQRSDITLSTFIHLAWAVVFSRALGTNEFVINIIQSGRDAPVPGIEDIIAPTTSVTPLRIPTRPQQPTHDLLRFLRDFKSAMMPFEHMSFEAIRDINPKIKTILDNSVHINILPFLDDDELGCEMGLKIVDSYFRWNTPFWICCMPSDSAITLRIKSVDGIISDERVKGLMCQFQCALEQLMGAHLVRGKAHTLGDVDIDGAGENCDF